MILKCSKCSKEVDNTIFLPGETFKGIDDHHNPPQMFFKDINDWHKFEGRELLYLCRDCHSSLHKEIIKIMNAKAGTLKFNGSEYWLLQKMSIKQQKECAKEVFDFTNQWKFQKN